MKEKLVSIVIPSWDGKRNGLTKNLLKQLKEQSYKNIEIIVITKTKPVGLARNKGTKKSKGDIIVYIDDDIELGHKNVLKNMVSKLKNKDIGIVGASMQLPKNANKFQRKIAKQSRVTVPIKVKDEETDEVMSGCFGMRLEVIKKIGYWNEKITSATDTEIRYLVTKNKYKMMIPANTWVYHPPPKTFKAYLKKAYWYGLGSAHVKKESRVQIPALKLLSKKTIIFYVIFRFFTIPLELIFPRVRKIIERKKITISDFFKFDLVLAIGQYASLIGMIEGFLFKKSFRRM